MLCGRIRWSTNVNEPALWHARRKKNLPVQTHFPNENHVKCHTYDTGALGAREGAPRSCFPTPSKACLVGTGQGTQRYLRRETSSEVCKYTRAAWLHRIRPVWRRHRGKGKLKNGLLFLHIIHVFTRVRSLFFFCYRVFLLDNIHS